LKELHLSVAEAAKTMEITRQQLYNVMQGRSALTPEMALRFEQAFGGSADMWLRMQAAYDLAQARKHQGKMNIRALSSIRHFNRGVLKPACVWRTSKTEYLVVVVERPAPLPRFPKQRCGFGDKLICR
jgi:addiction module HigA family antidote